MHPHISAYHSSFQLPTKTKYLIKYCFNDIKWLNAFEKFSGVDLEPLHQVMASDGVPIGFLPAYIENESVCGTLRDRAFGRFAKLPIFKNWGTSNAISCSSPWGFFSGIECSETNKCQVGEAFLDHIDQIVSNRKLCLSGFTFVPESSLVLREQLEAHGYKSIPQCPTTFLELKWSSFDEYVSCLPSRNIRSVIRRERKKAKKLSFEWFEGANLKEHVFDRPLYAILMDLYNKTYHKYYGKRSKIDTDFLPNLWEIDKKNLCLCIAKLEKKVAAFSLLRTFENSAHIFMVGRDYDIADDFHSYFNTIYYEPIIQGIKNGWNTIYFRPGVYQAKLKRGCLLERLYLYIKGHNISSQIFLNIYASIARKYFSYKFSFPNLLKQ